MMVLSRAFVISLLVLVLAPQSNAKEIGWDDLVDMSAQSFEDPYRDLTHEQIVALRSVIVYQQELDNETASSEFRATAEARLAEAQDKLAADGIDADWLISQRWEVAERRERAATSGNPEVDGQLISLAGFAIAGPEAEDGTSVVYLVPERGMCSHMPPPNPNQMIRVRLNSDWRPRYVHEPVRLTGKVSITPTDNVFHIVDGPVQMRATFLMEADEVETIQQLRAQSSSGVDDNWAQRLAERLRGASAPLSSSAGSLK